jgi:hypothetical protein
MRRVFSSGFVLLCTRLTLAAVGVFTVSMAIQLFALANRNTPKLKVENADVADRPGTLFALGAGVACPR